MNYGQKKNIYFEFSPHILHKSPHFAPKKDEVHPIMGRLDTKAFGLKKTSRIKAFVFKFISVPAKWIRTARHYLLNIYTHNKSYQDPFALADG
jgi:hypothetical protein